MDENRRRLYSGIKVCGLVGDATVDENGGTAMGWRATDRGQVVFVSEVIWNMKFLRR